MPAWCRPCAKCPRSRRSWGCRDFLLRVVAVPLADPPDLRRCLWTHGCSGRRACCPAGPGCFVCPWAAARPRAVRAACCCLWLRWCSGRRVVCCRAGLLCVPVGGGPPARSPHASLTARSGRSRGPPWPCRRPPALRPGPASGGSPVPSGPSGALHTGGAWLLMLLGASARSPARPRRPRPPQPGPPVPCGPSGALPTGGVWSASISHAIPLELL